MKQIIYCVAVISLSSISSIFLPYSQAQALEEGLYYRDWSSNSINYKSYIQISRNTAHQV
jgi:hypothetical protein